MTRNVLLTLTVSVSGLLLTLMSAYMSVSCTTLFVTDEMVDIHDYQKDLKTDSNFEFLVDLELTRIMSIVKQYLYRGVG